MSRRADDMYIALIIDGERSVHAIGCGGGNYATMCGQSDDDDEQNGRRVPVKRGDKIDCRQCINTIRTAKKYRESDFRAEGRT